MKGRRWKKIYRENTRSREFPSYLLFVVDFFFTAVFSIFVVIAHIYLCITVLFLFPSRLFFSHFKSISIILSGAHNQSLCIKFIPFVGCILLKLLVCLECVSSFPDVCVFFSSLLILHYYCYYFELLFGLQFQRLHFMNFQLRCYFILIPHFACSLAFLGYSVISFIV